MANCTLKLMKKDESEMSEQRVVSIKELDSETKKKVYTNYIKRIKETEILIETARLSMKQVEILRKTNQENRHRDRQQTMLKKIKYR